MERSAAFVQMLVAIASAVAMQNALAPPPVCGEWRDCQRLAQEAYANRDYERFHDLAWLTVQKGPPRNPELMFLLARAQSLSGRPHDALVMLGRIASMGLSTDAATSDDFGAVRALRQWQEFAGAAAAPDLPPSSVAPIVTAPPPAESTPAVSVPAAAAARQAEESLRVPGTRLGSGGLAYDRASSRFIVTDPSRRDLMIIDERLRHLVVLVTAASAGFYEITGFEIDPSRGDLWVVSAEPAAAADNRAAACALHKLQLISGRPLQRFEAPGELQPCHFADVAVAHDGVVLVLDEGGKRLLRFRPATRAFGAVANLRLQSPTSVAPAGDRIAYVAHASGIARVDTVSGAVESVASAADVDLAGFERIRWVRDSLVGVQRLPDGRPRVARIKIAGRRASSVDVIDNTVAAADHPVAAVSGDEFYFLVHEPAGETADVVIRRSRVR